MIARSVKYQAEQVFSVFDDITDMINRESFNDLVSLACKCKANAAQVFTIILPRIFVLYKKKVPWQNMRRFLFDLVNTKYKKCLQFIIFIPESELLTAVTALDSSFRGKLETLFTDKRYHTIEGLSSLGFLCCHVANAFGGGAAADKNEQNERKKPFENIITCLHKQGTNFNISISSIKPGIIGSIAMTKRFGIEGSIGVVLDSGYIYEAFSRDSSTISKAQRYRTGGNKKGIAHLAAISHPTGPYNELLIKGWTVGGLFYTKGVQQEVIEKIRELAAEYSGKTYINPEWLTRRRLMSSEGGYATRQDKKKELPIYEIDPKDNNWKKI